MQKLLYLLGILLLLFLFATGCEGEPLSYLPHVNQRNHGEIFLPEKEPLSFNSPGEEEREGILYFPDAAKKFLVPITRRFPYSSTIARSTLEMLIGNPELEKELNLYGLTTVIPRFTEIRGITIKDSIARVDFSASFLTYPPEKERLVINSVLCTLKQFPNIKQVLILVEGLSLNELPGGTPGKLPLGPECRINIEVGDGIDDYREFTAIKVYFAYLAAGDRVFYVPVTRILPPQDDPVEAAILELLKGPGRNSGLFTNIPFDVKLLNFSVEEGTIIVNFSREIMKYRGGLTGEENILNQVVLTLTEHASVEKVKILIEGNEVTLPEGTALSLPLVRPQPLNLF